MKKTCVVVLLAFLPLTVLADTVTLTNPEQITLPAATSLDWRIYNINATSKQIQVQYRWKDAGGTVIKTGGPHEWMVWECENTCFDAVFGFTIRSQDVGTKIGAGLRTLIWNKFKTAVLSSGNNGTFGEE